MRSFHWLVGLGAFLCASAGSVQAQDVIQTSIFRRPAPPPAPPICICPPLSVMPGNLVPPGTEKPPVPGAEKQPLPGAEKPNPMAEPPATGRFGEGTGAGTAERASFNPTMFGDLIGGPSVRGNIRLPNGVTVSGNIPLVYRGSFKIADNESPRPMDRVFLTYNYFSHVNTDIVGSGAKPFDMHREVVGFEKTFFDGNASFGMRLPILQFEGASGLGFDPTEIGDLTMIFKWAFYNNRETGNVVSTGMVLTLPTGDTLFEVPGVDLHSTIFEPYIGAIWNFDNVYVHGFSALIVPSASSDATILLNDVGVGYWLYRNRQDRFITGIAPTIEGHLTTPLNHRGATREPFGLSDWFSMTAGVTFVLPNNSTLGVAIGAPLTGPRPYEMEAIASFNFRF